MRLSTVILDYVHTLRLRPPRAVRMKIVKADAAKVNNAPGVQLRAREVASPTVVEVSQQLGESALPLVITKWGTAGDEPVEFI